MLEFLRKAAQSWVAKGLIGLLVASFAVWGIGDVFRNQATGAVASVAGQKVGAKDFADALRRQQIRFAQRLGKAVSFSDMRKAGVDRQILAGLLGDAAIAAERERLGIEAPDKAVAKAVEKNRAFQGPDGSFSETTYRQTLAQQGLAPHRFEELVRDDIANQAVTDSLEGVGTPPPGAAQRIAGWRGEERSVAALHLPPGFAPDPGTPDDKALAAYVKAHEAEFREPDRRYGAYLLIDAEAIAKTLTPDEKAVRARYDQQIDRYRVEAKATVSQINFASMDAAKAAAGRIASGKIDFDGLATEKGLKPADLSLGSVTKADLPDPIAAAVFGLDTPGIAGPVATPLGAALLDVTKLEKGGTVPFGAVKAGIAQQVALEEAGQKIPDIADKVEDRRAAGDSLAKIAAEMPGVETGKIDGWAEDGTVEGDKPATPPLTDPAARKELATAQDHEERDFVALKDGSYFLASIDRIEPAHLPPMEKIHDRAVKAWQAEQRLEALRKIGEGIAKSVDDSGASLAKTAAGMGRKTDDIGPFARDVTPTGLPADIVPRVFEAAKGKAVVGDDPDTGGVVVAQVTAVKDMDPKALAAAAGQVEQAFRQSIKGDIKVYFTRAVETDLGATVNSGAIEDVFNRLGAGS